MGDVAVEMGSVISVGVGGSWDSRGQVAATWEAR